MQVGSRSAGVYLPRRDPFTKLLIDHDDNRQDVGVGGVGAVVGPQVVLQVLTELQQHHSVHGETVAPNNTHHHSATQCDMV